MIQFACTCGQSMLYPDSLAGRQVHCPRCQQLVTVPQRTGPVPLDLAGGAVEGDPSAGGKSPTSRMMGIILGLIMLATIGSPWEIRSELQFGEYSWKYSEQQKIKWSWDLVRDSGTPRELKVVLYGLWAAGLATLLAAAVMRRLPLAITYLVITVAGGAVFLFAFREPLQSAWEGLFAGRRIDAAVQVSSFIATMALLISAGLRVKAGRNLGINLLLAVAGAAVIATVAIILWQNHEEILDTWKATANNPSPTAEVERNTMMIFLGCHGLVVLAGLLAIIQGATPIRSAAMAGVARTLVWCSILVMLVVVLVAPYFTVGKLPPGTPAAANLCVLMLSALAIFIQGAASTTAELIVKSRAAAMRAP